MILTSFVTPSENTRSDIRQWQAFNSPVGFGEILRWSTRPSRDWILRPAPPSSFPPSRALTLRFLGGSSRAVPMRDKTPPDFGETFLVVVAGCSTVFTSSKIRQIIQFDLMAHLHCRTGTDPDSYFCPKQMTVLKSLDPSKLTVSFYR